MNRITAFIICIAVLAAGHRGQGADEVDLVRLADLLETRAKALSAASWEVKVFGLKGIPAHTYGLGIAEDLKKAHEQSLESLESDLSYSRSGSALFDFTDGRYHYASNYGRHDDDVPSSDREIAYDGSARCHLNRTSTGDPSSQSSSGVLVEIFDDDSVSDSSANEVQGSGYHYFPNFIYLTEELFRGIHRQFLPPLFPSCCTLIRNE